MKADRLMILLLFFFVLLLTISPAVQAQETDYWALIVCGSEGMSFQNNADYMYHVIRDHHAFDDVYYLSVDPSHPGVDGETTGANVRAAIRTWLATRSDDDDLVFIYFSSHGGGYHLTEGLEGGRLDLSGDEGDEHQENTIIVDGLVLNVLSDWDNDGVIDDRIGNFDADPYIDIDLDDDRNSPGGSLDGDFRTFLDLDGDDNQDDLLIDPDSDNQCDVAIDADASLASDGDGSACWRRCVSGFMFPEPWLYRRK